ncbi:Cyclin-dependent kinase 2-associated protein 1 [Acropora cervicornis]|uniref:Cyclin-dependent kinase 2-associated protein 1 n=1 Tax=Acropora cervicornis TaxID=6130 RepID=A0AAD9QJL5_ACRCE|nr:Cyclin-dependent kinase 2-associated protein 1 [Acropora cervicornis]
MSRNDVAVHSSSVHLQDLSRLVFAFNTDKGNSTFQVVDNGRDSVLHMFDVVSNPGIGMKKNDCALDQDQRANTLFKGLEGLEKIDSGNVQDMNTKEQLSSAGVDSHETKGTKNSLHMISALCDRLIETPDQNSKRFAGGTAPTMDAASSTCEGLTYHNNQDAMVRSASHLCSSHPGGFYPDHDSPSVNISAKHNSDIKSPDITNEQNGAGATRFFEDTGRVTVKNQQSHAVESLQSNDLTCAISDMQQMLTRISPPVQSANGSSSQISLGQSTFDDTFKLIPLKQPITGNGPDASASVAATHQGGSSSGTTVNQNSPGKYSELLAVIEELGKDIRPTYAGSKNAAERLKKGIMHARVLVRECLVETDKCARQ